MSFPYKARATLRYKSPPGSNEAISFGKGETVTVLAQEEEDWLRGRNEAGDEGICASPFSTLPALARVDILMRALLSCTSVPEQFVERIEEAGSQEEPSVAPANAAESKPQAANVRSEPAENETSKQASSFKDRIAAFNKPTSGPPPIRAKPPSIGRKPVPNSQTQVSVPFPPASKDVPAPAPPAPPTPSNNEANNAAMSASDAKESIARGGSLKDRIALLQGGFNAQAMQPQLPGKAPPRPWKKPAPVESVEAEDRPADVESQNQVATDPLTTQEAPEASKPLDHTEEEVKGAPSEPTRTSVSPPSSVPLPAIPRRAGPPRRKVPAKGASQDEGLRLSQPDEPPVEAQPQLEAGEARQVPLSKQRPDDEPDLQSLSVKDNNEDRPVSPVIQETFADEPSSETALDSVDDKLQAPSPPISRRSSSESLRAPEPMHQPSLPLPPRLSTDLVPGDEADRGDQPPASPALSSRSTGSLRSPEPMHQPSLPIPPAKDSLPLNSTEEESQGTQAFPRPLKTQEDDEDEFDKDDESSEDEGENPKEALMKRMAAMGGLRIGQCTP